MVGLLREKMNEWMKKEGPKTVYFRPSFDAFVQPQKDFARNYWAFQSNFSLIEYLVKPSIDPVSQVFLGLNVKYRPCSFNRRTRNLHYAFTVRVVQDRIVWCIGNALDMTGGLYREKMNEWMKKEGPKTVYFCPSFDAFVQPQKDFARNYWAFQSNFFLIEYLDKPSIDPVSQVSLRLNVK